MVKGDKLQLGESAENARCRLRVLNLRLRAGKVLTGESEQYGSGVVEFRFRKPAPKPSAAAPPP